MAIGKIKCALFACSFLLHQQAFTQSNYQPAIIINNNGDSVKGKIDYRNWKKNPETISFIDDAEIQHTLNPNSIKGFIIPSHDEVYSSYTVDVDMRPGDADEAIQNTFIDSPILHKSVFLLRLIANPAVQLYQLTDNNKEHYYFVQPNGVPVELIHHYRYDEPYNQVKENEQYKQQLTDLFSDCPNVTSGLKTIKFKKRDIENSFLHYLQCKGASNTTTVHKIEDASTVSFGAMLGIMHTSYSFEGTDENLVDPNYSSSTTPVLGVALDVGLPRGRNQWHIVNELLYKTYKTGSTFTRPYNINYTRTTTVELDFSYLQLNSMLRYVYPSAGALKPYLNLGIGNAFMIVEKTNRLHQSYSFGTEEETKAFDPPSKYEFSLLAGIGLRIHRIEVEFRYAGSKKSFSPFHNLDVNPKSIQGLLLFRF
jgi:hypothetical protein